MGHINIPILDAKDWSFDNQSVLVLVLIAFVIHAVWVVVEGGFGKVVRGRDWIEQGTLLPMFMFWAHYIDQQRSQHVGPYPTYRSLGTDVGRTYTCLWL